MRLDEIRLKLSGWHFAKEALHPQAREVLLVAEAVLAELDRLHGGYARVELTPAEATEVASFIGDVLARRRPEH